MTRAEVQGRTFDPQVGDAVRLWPHLYDTGSFFAARIDKRDAFSLPAEPLPRSGRGSFAPLPSADQARIAAGLRETFNFDLDALLDELGLDVWLSGRMVHAIPRLLDTHFDGLPVRAAGMLLGEMGEGNFTPSHELISRFFDRFTAGRLTLADDEAAAFQSIGEVDGSFAGRVALLEDSRGRFLGRGRPSDGRIRAMLPAGF